MLKGEKMTDAQRLQRSEYMKAHPLPSRKGIKYKTYNISEEGRARLIETLSTRKISQKVIEHTRLLNKGKFGSSHPKWTEEKKRPFYSAIRTLSQYKDWRASIFERNDFTCQSCGKRGGDLEADHNPKRFIEIVRDNNLKTISQAIECKELWEAKGRTLCKNCHLKTYAKVS